MSAERGDVVVAVDPFKGGDTAGRPFHPIDTVEDRAGTANHLHRGVPREDASRYGVCDTNTYGEATDVVETPEDPPSNLVMTGCYTFTPAIFHACHLLQPLAASTRSPRRSTC
jgi:NDP-sugar pyrophosphorylase family protein